MEERHTRKQIDRGHGPLHKFFSYSLMLCAAANIPRKRCRLSVIPLSSFCDNCAKARSMCARCAGKMRANNFSPWAVNWTIWRRRRWARCSVARVLRPPPIDDTGQRTFGDQCLFAEFPGRYLIVLPSVATISNCAGAGEAHAHAPTNKPKGLVGVGEFTHKRQKIGEAMISACCVPSYGIIV